MVSVVVDPSVYRVVHMRASCRAEFSNAFLFMGRRETGGTDKPLFECHRLDEKNIKDGVGVRDASRRGGRSY